MAERDKRALGVVKYDDPCMLNSFNSEGNEDSERKREVKKESSKVNYRGFVLEASQKKI